MVATRRVDADRGRAFLWCHERLSDRPLRAAPGLRGQTEDRRELGRSCAMKCTSAFAAREQGRTPSFATR